MQLLGKEYFGADGNPLTDAMQAEGALSDALSGDGLDALCSAVMKKRKYPKWMNKMGKLFSENKKQFIVAASVLIIGFAIYLNWAVYDTNVPLDGGTDIADLQSTVDAASDSMASADSTAASADTGTDNYFSTSLINRQRARDEAIEVLQNVVDGAENMSDVRDDALADIAQIAADIEHEASIESLVKGKGFADCIAVISGENANIIVRSAALLPNEITQIQEIVYETAGILPANIKIIEK